MTKSPDSLKEIKSLKITAEIKEFTVQLAADIEEEESQLTQWANAVDVLDRLRYGRRRKKTRPWPGAANFSLPIIDTDINVLKPAYINVGYGVSPIVTFEPYGPEDVEPARKRELLFDWRMRTQVKFFKPYSYGIDMILGSLGQTVFRTIWKFESRTYTINLDITEFPDDVQETLYDPRTSDEMLAKIIEEENRIDMEYEENVIEVAKAVEKFREGKVDIELTLMETSKDYPEVTALSPKDDLVIPTDTKNIQDARFIDYKNLWMTKNDLKIAMRDEKYEKYSDSDIDSWAGKNSSKEGSKDVSDDMILLHETCCYYDVNNDGIDEKCIVTWPDASPTSILRFIENPYDHGLWPYEQVKREFTEDGFYASRGIPSLDEDTQVGASTALNQAVDNGTLLNMPERVAKKGVISNPRNRRFIPGEFTEINGNLTDYETRTNVNNSQPVLFQQIQFLKSFSDARLGQQTAGFGQTSLPGSGQGGKKTAKEIGAIQLEQGSAKSLDIQIFQQQMAGVYFQIDALYNQFGSDEESIQITGSEPIKVSRDETQGRFNIVPNGRLDNSTPGARLQKSMLAFQVGVDNPIVRQDVLTKEIFKDISPRLAGLAIKSDEEMAQEAQSQTKAIADAEAKEFSKVVGTQKIGDDLEVRKAILMEPIQGKKYAPG